MSFKARRGFSDSPAALRRRRSRRLRYSRRIGYPAVALAGLLVAVSGNNPSSAGYAAAPAADLVESPAVAVKHDAQPVEPIQPAKAVAPMNDRVTAATGAGPEREIPPIVLDSYRRAEAVVGHREPGCHLSWPMLAGIGTVESGNAENADVHSDGTVSRPIFGPVLNGMNGTAAIPTEGVTDHNARWARAEGPMQFLPSTWEKWGADGNPQNVYDASLAAGRYLCAGGRDLNTDAGLTDAILSYNDSPQYLNIVLQWIRAYQTGGVAPYEPGEFNPADPADGTESDPSAYEASDASPSPAPANNAGPPRPEGPSGGAEGGAGKQQPQPAPTGPAAPSQGLLPSVQRLLPAPVQGLLPAPVSDPNGLVSALEH